MLILGTLHRPESWQEFDAYLAVSSDCEIMCNQPANTGINHALSKVGCQQNPPTTEKY